MSGEAALMCPARRRSRPHVCVHILCTVPTTLLGKVSMPFGLKIDVNPQKLYHARRRHDLHAGHRTKALRHEAPVHFQYATLPI